MCPKSSLFWLTSSITVWKKAAILMRRIKLGLKEEFKVGAPCKFFLPLMYLRSASKKSNCHRL